MMMVVVGTTGMGECQIRYPRVHFLTVKSADAVYRTRFFFFFFGTLLLSSFWTRRGHRCHSFSSPVLAFNFYRA